MTHRILRLEAFEFEGERFEAFELCDCESAALVKLQSQFLEYPAKEPTEFVLQAHVRGRSNHLDLRFALDASRLAGYTLTGVDGLSREPSSLEEARRLAEPGIDRAISRLLDPLRKTLAEPKAIQPRLWLDIHERAFAPGEIGATTEKQGWIFEVDRGTLKHGSQTNDFHEYFVRGKRTQGRLAFRQLARKALSKAEDAPKQEVFLWIASFTKAVDPFVLSRRAVQEGFVPPHGRSALPSDVEAKVPEALRYWTTRDERKRRELRDRLVEEIKGKRIELDMAEHGVLRGRFALQHRIWRGPLQVRTAASSQLWDLRLAVDDETQARHFVLDADPLREREFSATLEAKTGRDALDLGKDGLKRLEPGTALNPTKATPAFVELVDAGSFQLLGDERDAKTIRFDGRRLRGAFSFTRQDQTAQFGVRKMSESIQDLQKRAGSFPYPKPYPYPYPYPKAGKAAEHAPYPGPNGGGDGGRLMKVVERLLGMAATPEADKRRLKEIMTAMTAGKPPSKEDVAYVSLIRRQMGVSLAEGPWYFSDRFPQYPFNLEFAEHYPEAGYPFSFCRFALECPARGKEPGPCREAAQDCVHAQEFGCPVFLSEIRPVPPETFEASIRRERDGTYTLDKVEILRTGTWNGWNFKESDLDLIARNFHELRTELEPPVKLGHHEDQALLTNAGEMAAGWVKNVYREATRLFADLVNVPAKVLELLKKKAFKKRSAEVYRDYQDTEGRNRGKVLKALSFLGASTPAVKGMRDLDDALAMYLSEYLSSVEDGTTAFVFDMEMEEPMTQPANQTTTATAPPPPPGLPEEEVAKRIQVAVQQRDAEISALKGNVTKLQESLRTTEVKATRAMDQEAYAKLLNAGKLVPKQKDAFLLLMDAVQGLSDEAYRSTGTSPFLADRGFDQKTLSFSVKTQREGKETEERLSPRALVLSVFEMAEPQLAFGVHSRDRDLDRARATDQQAASGAPRDRLMKLAQQIQGQQKDLPMDVALEEASRQLREQGVTNEELNS